MTLRTPLALILAILAGCAAAPRGPELPSSPYPPSACEADTAKHARLLTLPPTPADPSAAGDPGALAQTLPIDRKLSRVGRWQHRSDGWSSLTVSLESSGARSLALHLSGLMLPPDTQIWFCTPDGRERLGPYRDAAGGELWTPPLRGDRALLQIWVPTSAHKALGGRLAEAQGGYR
ncbi:hypothetical protein [Sinimarinibacterium thermocellulolyticum]|uniref:Lipoprotein n=1 Tax=Sinimarinibacterium thermocellulolyticum TaxID=3170016 RepID=A0ABV2AB86_9GAMM